MERRALERMPVGKDIRISYRKKIYSGTVLNLSEKGMFIGTSECFPPDSIIRIESELLNTLVKVNWVTEMDGYYDGIGVEVIKKKEN
jgi:hypothetical protein